MGEQCVVSTSAGISLESCLEAIAAGDGREVMQIDKARVVRAYCLKVEVNWCGEGVSFIS
jgi:hypothetical protein